MRAAVIHEYGPPEVLHVAEVDQPVPKPDEVRLRVRAAAVRFGDLMVRNLAAVSPATFTMPSPLWLPVRLMFGWRKPKTGILGSEFSGEVESVGSNVSRFRPGDAVMGYRGPRMGANAEYLCMPEDGMITAMPENLSFEEAAAVPYGAVTALGVLARVPVQRGQRVLINGASGGIGAAALQICKHHFGATLTGVCGTERVEMVRALGADHVIDYRESDFTDSDERWDLVLDVLGRSSFERVRRVLTPQGHYLLASFKTRHLLRMVRTRFGSGPRLVCALASENADDLNVARQMAEAGKLRPVIDRSFPLEWAAEAHRYVESGARTGVVVITP